MLRPAITGRFLRPAALAVLVTAGAILAPGAGAAPRARAASAIGAYTTRGAWSFVSAPRLHPPKLRGTYSRGARRSLAPGDFLVTSFPNLAVHGPLTGQGGPLILDSGLRPVWSYPVSTRVAAAGLQQETYTGAPVLVWWEGTVTRTGATARGEVVVVDQHYRKLATIRAKAPWVISLHDATISGRDIWVTAYRNVRGQDLRPYRGARRGTVYDAGVQEYDLGTGRLLYTWDALNPGHAPSIPLSASEQPPPRSGASSWDAYHLNSVQVVAPGRLLISMRNTWGVYLLDTATQRIIWTLGGKHSTYRVGRGAHFAWQHDAKLLAGNEVTLFSDNCCKLLPSGGFAPTNGPSEGMVIRLDPVRGTASLVAAYRHAPNRYVAFLGSMQVLPGGGALVGWGSLPFFSEFSGSRRQLLDAAWPGKDQSYRALYTDSWIGTPYYPPAGAARRRRGKTTVYASWNGATQVSRWQVLAGPSSQRLSVVATALRSGFETAIGLGSASYQEFEIRALDAGGRTLGTSAPFRSR